MTKQRIQDDGDLRKYRIEIPNMADDELDPYEFRLYAHYKRVCGGNGGTCWESVRTTAERTKISTAKVVDTRRALEEGGWIKVTEHKTGTYQIIIVDRWLENFKKYATPEPEPAPEPERSPDKQPPEDVSQANGVLATLTECSPGEHPVSQNNRRREPIKKEQKKKEPEKESSPTVFALYEANIGPLTPIIADRLGACIDDYGEEWTRQAIEVAAERNKRSMAYIEAVLKGCKAEGKPPKAPISLEKKLVRQYALPDDYATEPLPAPLPLMPGEDTWQGIRDDLQRQMPRETFNTWLKDCVFAGRDGHIYTLTSDNKYAVEWLRHRLMDVMNKTLRLHTENEAAEFRIVMPGLAVAEAAAADFNQANGIQPAPRKPGEVDRHLGSVAPKLAGQKEIA